jgi:hypothetical protein
MARYRRFEHARAGATAVEPAMTALDDVRVRRAGLKAAMRGLDTALADAAPGRLDEWALGVRDALAVLHDVWTRHIVETEATGAFLDELVDQAPRLASPAARLRHEHTEILAVIDAATRDLQVIPADADRADAFVESLRAQLTAMLSALSRHHQRGADLIYEAYDVDLGGG